MSTFSEDRDKRLPFLFEEINVCSVKLLVGLFTVFYLTGCFTTRFDRDEWQIMVAAAEVAKGARLYVDIWDNHGPLLTLVLGGGIRLLDTQDHALLMYGGRLLMMGFLLSTLWLVGRLARYSCPESTLISPVAILVLLCSHTFFGKGLEIRSDVPLLLVWTLCLLLLVRGFNDGKVSRFLNSGLVLGLGFAFSLKTLLLGATCGIAMLFVMGVHRKFSFQWLLAFGAGVLPAPLAMLIVLHGQGSLEAFLNSYLGQNFDRIGEPWLMGLSEAWHAERLLLLMFALVCITVLRCRRKRTLPVAISALIVVSVTLLVFYMRLPTHYRQSLLPLLPAVAVVIAWGIGQFPPRIRLWRWSLPLNYLLAVLVVISGLEQGWFRYKSWADLKVAEDRQALIPREALLFEGVGLPLFQPRPFIYKAFVKTICSRIQNGQLDIDVPLELDRKDVPYAALDGRVLSMGHEVTSFVLQNYLPLHSGELLAAGVILPATAGDEVLWRVRIAGRYFVSESSLRLQVDGRPAGKMVTLDDGIHSFVWSGGSPLVLSIAPPQQWASAETLIAWQKKASLHR